MATLPLGPVNPIKPNRIFAIGLVRKSPKSWKGARRKARLYRRASEAGQGNGLGIGKLPENPARGVVNLSAAAYNG